MHNKGTSVCASWMVLIADDPDVTSNCGEMPLITSFANPVILSVAISLELY